MLNYSIALRLVSATKPARSELQIRCQNMKILYILRLLQVSLNKWLMPIGLGWCLVNDWQDQTNPQQQPAVLCSQINRNDDKIHENRIKTEECRTFGFICTVCVANETFISILDFQFLNCSSMILVVAQFQLVRSQYWRNFVKSELRS